MRLDNKQQAAIGRMLENVGIHTTAAFNHLTEGRVSIEVVDNVASVAQEIARKLGQELPTSNGRMEAFTVSFMEVGSDTGGLSKMNHLILLDGSLVAPGSNTVNLQKVLDHEVRHIELNESQPKMSSDERELYAYTNTAEDLVRYKSFLLGQLGGKNPYDEPQSASVFRELDKAITSQLDLAISYADKRGVTNDYTRRFDAIRSTTPSTDSKQ